MTYAKSKTKFNTINTFNNVAVIMASKNTERAVIPFGKGIHRNPSVGSDGELSECVNLLPKGEEMTGVPMPVDTGMAIYTGQKWEKLMCVHHVNGKKHYVVSYNNWGALRPGKVYDYTVVIRDDGLYLYTNEDRANSTATIVFTYEDGSQDQADIDIVSSFLPVKFENGVKWQTETVTEISVEVTTDDRYSHARAFLVDNRGNGNYVYIPPKTRDPKFKLQYFTEDNQKRVDIIGLYDLPKKVIPYGNMLLCQFSEGDGVNYIIYKDGAYQDLGESLPEINTRLSLEGKLHVLQSDSTIKIIESTGQVLNYDKLFLTISDTDAKTRTTYVPTNTWKFLNDQSYIEPEQPLEKNVSYRFCNSSKYDLYILLASETVLDNANDLDGIYAFMIKKGKSKDVKIDRDDYVRIYYTSNGWHSEKTFHAVCRIYKSENTSPGLQVDESDNNGVENLSVLMGTANKFIAESMSEDSKFVLPFFARVGLRLFDGSITRLTEPILLVPNSGTAPHVYIKGDKAGNYSPEAFGMRCDLQYMLTEQDLISLRRYDGIINSVVICATGPIYQYNEGYAYQTEKQNFTLKPISVNSDVGLITGYDEDYYSISKCVDPNRDIASFTAQSITDESSNEPFYYDPSVSFTLRRGDKVKFASCDSGIYVIRYEKLLNQGSVPIWTVQAKLTSSDDTFVCPMNGTYYLGSKTENAQGSVYISDSQYDNYTRRDNYSTLYDSAYIGVDDSLKQIALPKFDADEIRKNYVDKSNYYVVDEIKLNELKAGVNTIDLSGRDLMGIRAWESVKDDTRTHNILNPGCIFSYNNRLHFGNITEVVWCGRTPNMHVGYEEITGLAKNNSVRAIVTISQGGELVYADSGWSEDTQMSGLYWFYYPNVNALSADVYIRILGSDGTYRYSQAKLTLSKHVILDGAYWFDGMNYANFLPCSEEEATRSVNASSLYYPSKLYVSEPDNPWTFPITQRITVGTGKILALANTAVALSQNQYGRSVLQAFCSDGIWELQMNDLGAYVCKNPTSRDVISNPDCLVMLDGAIAFPTDKGLNLLTSHGVTLISEAIEGRNGTDGMPDILTSLDRFFLKTEGVAIQKYDDAKMFKDVLKSSMLSYDYAHSCLHVIPQDKTWNYAYDIRSGEWAIQLTGYAVDSIVNDYPDTIIGASDGKIYRYDNVTDTDTVLNAYQLGYLLTRPLSLGNPVARKAISDLRAMRYYKSEKGYVGVVLFASNDLRTWTRVRGLKVFSAKYYRVLLMAKLTELDTLNGIVMDYVGRYTGKMA